MKKILVVIAAVIFMATSTHFSSSTIVNDDKDNIFNHNSVNTTFSGGFSVCTKFLLFDLDGAGGPGHYIDPEPSTHGIVYFFEDVYFNLSTKMTPSSPITGFICSFPHYFVSSPTFWICCDIQGFTGIIIRIGNNVLLGCGTCMASEGWFL